MSQENLEMARRSYAAFNRGDWEGMVADIGPDFEYVTTGTIPGVGGVYRGPEGLRRFLESFWGEFDEPSLEVRELIEAEDQVLAALTFRGRGKQSGVETESDIAWLVEFKNGKGARVREYLDPEEALKAAGLSE